jgi:hypothetical protein
MLLRSVANHTVLYVKRVSARTAMVKLPNLHVAGHGACAERASINKGFRHDVPIFHLKCFSASLPVIYSARAHSAVDSNITKRTYVMKLFCCSLPLRWLRWLWQRLRLVSCARSLACLFLRSISFAFALSRGIARSGCLPCPYRGRLQLFLRLFFGACSFAFLVLASVSSPFPLSRDFRHYFGYDSFLLLACNFLFGGSHTCYCFSDNASR